MKFKVTNAAGVECGCVVERDERGRETLVTMCADHDSEFSMQRSDDLERHAVERARLSEDSAQ